MDLVTEHLGQKPVLAVIYSHTHGDHFGGVLGVTTHEDVNAGKVKILAPEGFMEHVISENVIAGPAMNRRVRYQIGGTLNRAPMVKSPRVWDRVFRREASVSLPQPTSLPKPARK